MKYSEAVYISAQAELDKRRAQAQKLQELHRNEVASKYPELEIIEKEIRNTVLKAIQNYGTIGGDGIAALAKTNLEAQKEEKLLLKAAGYPEDYLEPQYFCKICSDTGEADGKICKCKLEIMKQKLLETLPCSPMLALSKFETFDLNYYSTQKEPELGCSPRDYMRGALEMAKAYAENFSDKSESFFFCGATGLGKTHLSLAIMNRVVEKGFNVYYGSAGRIIKEMDKERFGRSTDNIEEEMADADLLIIDDLGTEFETAFSKSAVYEIVNEALLSGKPMIINSNLSKSELENRYGERVASRLNSFEVVNFCGTDIRQLKK